MSADNPTYTRIPNALLDDWLPRLKETELKVVLYLYRKTVGFQRDTDAISLSQFMKGTGLSRQGVMDGLAGAAAHGLLCEVGTAARKVRIYQVVQILDQSTKQTTTGQNFRPQPRLTGQKSRHTKEKEIKETQKKERAQVNSRINGVPKSECADICNAWAANLANYPIKPYSTKNMEVAADIWLAGYRAHQVGLCVKAKMADEWWIGKTLTLAKVAELLPDYVRSLAPKSTERQLPPEVIHRPNIEPVEWGTDFFVRKPISAVQHD